MILRIILPAVAALGLVSCQTNKTNPDYDTNDPYGVPDYSAPGYGAETADYQSVNPPADATYAPAAYEDTAAVPAAPVAARSHTVVRGDTLWGLGRKYGVSADAIRAANNLSGDTVVLGTTLQIPGN